jgi:hypothetical protein
LLQGVRAQDGPPDHAKQAVHRPRRAALAQASLPLEGFRALASVRDASVEEDSNGLVPDEHPPEELVEVFAIAGDDDELLNSGGLVVESTSLQAPHELVERALAPAVTGEACAPQDLDGRRGWLFAQPLRDLRRIARQLRRASDTASFRTLHGGVFFANPIPESNSRKISHFWSMG